MLTDFFRISLPYGLQETDSGKWYAFNREYIPIGFNDYHMKPDRPFKHLSIHCDYKLTDDIINAIVSLPGGGLQKDKSKRRTIFLYDDETNPQSRNKSNLWDSYLSKIKLLSSLNHSGQ